MQQYTWFYSLKSPLLPEQEKALLSDFQRFIQSWKSHGTPVEGEMLIREKRFVIASANPEGDRPSGCSIDNLRRTIETILTRNGIEWLEAGYIFYRQPDGDIVPVHFRDIQSLIHAGQIGADTIVFDHSLDQSDDLGRWEVPMSQTWLRRYLVSPAAV
ncbi:MAG: hypothetical protein EAZ89_18325 [Bacteroidetes bacterium]|nr:MAG: hypothetical protein EAZ89_18325 [Bacteroidota bacterium]